MYEFDRIKDMIYDELDNISNQGQLNKESVCIIGELVDILKDMGTVEMFEDGNYFSEDDYSINGGYSRNGGYSQRGGYSRGNSYEGNGGSYRSGRIYMSGDSRRGGGRSRYSREDAKEHMIEKLEHLMNEAQNEKDKQSIQRLIEQMENN